MYFSYGGSIFISNWKSGDQKHMSSFGCKNNQQCWGKIGQPICFFFWCYGFANNADFIHFLAWLVASCHFVTCIPGHPPKLFHKPTWFVTYPVWEIYQPTDKEASRWNNIYIYIYIFFTHIYIYIYIFTHIYIIIRNYMYTWHTLYIIFAYFLECSIT